jgi:hypothetical protein
MMVKAVREEDFYMSRAALEGLLEHFAAAALGLMLEARIRDASELPAGHRQCLTNSHEKPNAWVAWHTNRGPVSARAAYDHEQSQRMAAHVLCLAWWIDLGEHHEGWWHCYPKRPNEWVKGRGT